MEPTKQQKPRTRQAAGGRRRDRAATKQRLVDAVGSVLVRDGVLALGVNSIAKQANVDKVLIYRYFSNLDGLYRVYAEKVQLWPDLADVAGDAPAVLHTLPPVDRLALMLGNFAEALARRPWNLDVVAWRTLETNALTDALTAQQAKLDRQMRDLTIVGSGLSAEIVELRLTTIVDAIAMDLVRHRQSDRPAAATAAPLQDLAGWIFSA